MFVRVAIDLALDRLFTYEVPQELEKKLAEAERKCAAEGCSFNEDFAYCKDGKPVTVVRKLSKEEIDLSVRRVARIVKEVAEG